MYNEKIDNWAFSASLMEKEGDNQTAIVCLANLFNAIQDSSSQLLHLRNYESVGNAYMLMTKYQHFMNVEDARRVIADNAFYCISKAIEQAPSQSLYIKRLTIIDTMFNDFFYTVANALDIPDGDIFEVPFIPLKIKANTPRFNMAYHDFKKSGLFNNVPPSLLKLHSAVMDGNYDIEEGRKCIDAIVSYLENVYRRY